eukprot:TRINITY_DN2751_c0_g1_i1.p2 TRINITY_DN2751_c0_g1~~TRINITY_DN2751_c0_g1_i1.p2  ORF type:complete len:144 (-),score=23.82 TRINITY_DN2751_c0_g1_i1:301-708(-)
MKGTVVINVIGLKNYSHRHAYIDIFVQGGKPWRVTTKVVRGTFSPVWNETFTFEVDMAHQRRCMATVYLKDKRFLVGKYVGQMRFDCGDEVHFPSDTNMHFRLEPFLLCWFAPLDIPKPSTMTKPLNFDVTVTWH